MLKKCICVFLTLLFILLWFSFLTTLVFADYTDNIFAAYYELSSTANISSNINCTTSTNVYHSGSSSLYTYASTDTPLNNLGKIMGIKIVSSTSFPVTNGKKYYYSYWIKNSNTALQTITLYQQYYYKKTSDGSTVYKSIPNGSITLKLTTDWQYVSGIFTADLSAYETEKTGSGATPIQWALSSAAYPLSSSLTDINIYFDQVSLREIPDDNVNTTNLTYTVPASGTENISDDVHEVDFYYNTSYLDTSSIYNAEVSLNGGVLSNDYYSIEASVDSTNNVSQINITFNNSIKLKGKTVAIAGVTDLWGRKPETTTTYPITYDLPVYNDTSILLDENFRSTYTPPGEDATHASGWDVDESGGYITGRSTYHGFKIVDNSTTAGVAMAKELREQSSGVLVWEFGLSLDKLDSNTEFKLGNDTNNSVLLRFQDGELYYVLSNKEYGVVSYTANTNFGIKVVIDLDNSISDIYCDGVLKTHNLELYSDCTINKITITTGDEETGIVGITTIRINKDYIVNEKFVTYLSGSFLSDEWSADTAGGSVVTQNCYESIYDPYCVQLTDEIENASVSVEKQFDGVEANAFVWEYNFLVSKKDNYRLAEIKYGDTVAFNVYLSSNGEVYYGDDSVNNIICDYDENLWYHLKILFDMTDNTADIYVNYKLKCQNVSFDASVIGFDNIKYSTSDEGTGSLRIDDIKFYIKQSEPEDYVSVPQPVESDYLLSILACDIWREGNSRGWDSINRFPERTPLMGFYDEGNPEVSDWEIKWLTEHGISNEIFCWYNSNYVGQPIKTPICCDGINAYLDAKYSSYLNFSILWCNESITSTNFRSSIVPYWIEYYFKDDRYLKIDNKPVLYVLSPSVLLSSFGGYTGLEAEIDYLNAQCAATGFDGIKIIVYPTLNDFSDSEKTQWLAAGADAFFVYGHGSYNSIKTVKNRYLSGFTQHVPVLSVKQNKEAWIGVSDRYSSPAEFKELAAWFKNDLLPVWDFSNIGTNMLIIDNLNEYGEGHYIMPTEKLGFSNLDVIRDVFTTGGTHTDAVPTDNQKSRITLLYSQDRDYYEEPLLGELPLELYSLKSWDYSGSSYGTLPIANNISNLRVENGVLKGTVTGSDPYIRWSDLSADISTSHSINVKMKTTGTTLAQMLFTTSQNTDYSPSMLINFASNVDANSINEYIVDMRENDYYNGLLTGLRLDIPAAAGDEFEIKSVSIMSNKLICGRDDLIANGDFEGDTLSFNAVNTGTDAVIQHNDFYYGSSALYAANETSDGEVECSVSDFYAPASFYYSAYAKLPYGTSSSGTLQAYLRYTIGGTQYESNRITSNMLSEGYWTRMSGTFDIEDLCVAANVYLCIVSDFTGISEFYLDNVCLQQLSTKYTSSISQGATNVTATDTITFDFEDSLSVSSLLENTTFVENGSEEEISFDVGNINTDYECTSQSNFNSDINIALDTTAYYSGNSSMKVYASADKPLKTYGRLLGYPVYNSFPVENGNVYYYSFWIKNSNTALTSVGIYTPYYFKKAGETTNTFATHYYGGTTLSATTDWQFVSGYFTADLSEYEANSGATPVKWTFLIAAMNTGGSDLTDIQVNFDRLCICDVNNDDYGINEFKIKFDDTMDTNTEYNLILTGLSTKGGYDLPPLNLLFSTGGLLLIRPRKYYKNYKQNNQTEVSGGNLQGEITSVTEVQNLFRETINGTHIIAVYDENKLVNTYKNSFNISSLSSLNLEAEMDIGEYDAIKEFLWSDLNDLKPLN